MVKNIHKRNNTGSTSIRQEAQSNFQMYRARFFLVLGGLIILVRTFQARYPVPSVLLLEMGALSGTTDIDEQSATPAPNLPRKVHFLTDKQVSFFEGFSASWLQSRSSFMEMNLEGIATCEDAAFRAYWYNGRRQRMRMTLDWMDWSLEHMSRWWRILSWDLKGYKIPYRAITGKFSNYITNGTDNFPVIEKGDSGPIFQSTLAVIPFQSYRNFEHPEMGDHLTSMSLAATLESLRRAGFGRTTVSVLVTNDVPMVESAFRYLKEKVEPNYKNLDSPVYKIGHMEVGYTFASHPYIPTPVLVKNMPRATLMTLKDAFTYSEMDVSLRQPEMNQNVTAWLGDTQDPSYWQYVYLTEGDSILHARPSAMKAMKDEADKGNIMLPHRWQPIPHESDVPYADKAMKNFLLLEEFPEVLEFNPEDACCDEEAGDKSQPGKKGFEKCAPGTFWYACGFHPKLNNNADRHQRLGSYKLMRMTGGTGIVSIVGSEQSRRCIPNKNGICLPRNESNSQAP